MGFIFSLGAIAGILFGIALTALIMGIVVKRSNDWGDSDGLEQTLEQFDMLESKNHVKESFPVGIQK